MIGAQSAKSSVSSDSSKDSAGTFLSSTTWCRATQRIQRSFAGLGALKFVALAGRLRVAPTRSELLVVIRSKVVLFLFFVYRIGQAIIS